MHPSESPPLTSPDAGVRARSLGRRLSLLADEGPRVLVSRVLVRASIAVLTLTNRTSRRSVLGHGDAVLNLTTYGRRTGQAHLAIESIAAGTVRPRRMILWVDDPAVAERPPAPLARLRRRGLEILTCPDFGPHKKQYPFALLEDESGSPLVAGDDDVVYPRRWLAGLLHAHAEDPDAVTGYRARTVVLAGDRLAPYEQWAPRRGTSPSYAAICTGVSGVVYPPALLAALREEGEAFLELAPTADDIWVHAVSVRHGIRTRQAQQRHREFPSVPGSQTGALIHQNVFRGANDRWIRTAYTAQDRARLREDLASVG